LNSNSVLSFLKQCLTSFFLVRHLIITILSNYHSKCTNKKKANNDHWSISFIIFRWWYVTCTFVLRRHVFFLFLFLIKKIANYWNSIFFFLMLCSWYHKKWQQTNKCRVLIFFSLHLHLSFLNSIPDMWFVSIYINFVYTDCLILILW
jgi:hypothetical protein